MLLHVERHQEDQDHEVRADLAETTNAWSGKHHFITWLKPPGGNPLRAVFFLQGHLFDDHKKMVKGIQMICKMFENIYVAYFGAIWDQRRQKQHIKCCEPINPALK